MTRLGTKHYPDVPTSGDGPWPDSDARSDELHKISQQFEIERVGRLWIERLWAKKNF